MISRHQHFNATDDPKYLICDRHFHKQNIKRKDGRIALKNGTVPAIFPRRIVYVFIDLDPTTEFLLYMYILFYFI